MRECNDTRQQEALSQLRGPTHGTFMRSAGHPTRGHRSTNPKQRCGICACSPSGRSLFGFLRVAVRAHLGGGEYEIAPHDVALGGLWPRALECVDDHATQAFARRLDRVRQPLQSTKSTK